MLFLLAVVTFPLFGQTKDTTFIVREKIDAEFHSIYIDRNKNSKSYDEISHFDFQQFDAESYKLSTDFLAENKIKLRKSKPLLPWKNWIALQQYKGDFYVYEPCDFLFHFRQSVNDSTFIDWTGEGPTANAIVDQKKIDNKTYEFKLSGIYEQNRTVKIHIVDRKKGIAVFEQIVGADKKYYLMIAAEKIRNVPIIVNHCPTQKQLELEFDEPDFSAILSSE